MQRIQSHSPFTYSAVHSLTVYSVCSLWQRYNVLIWENVHFNFLRMISHYVLGIFTRLHPTLPPSHFDAINPPPPHHPYPPPAASVPYVHFLSSLLYPPPIQHTASLPSAFPSPFLTPPVHLPTPSSIQLPFSRFLPSSSTPPYHFFEPPA